jgi:hypothetical protein
MALLHRPGGLYRRRIILYAEMGFVRAAVEDDFHHFEVDLRHDKGRVTDIEGRALRHPWTTCPGAAAALQDFVAQPIETKIIRRKDVTDVTHQCTHMHDIALLAIARAARGPGCTRYDIEVPDRIGRTRFPPIKDGLLYRLLDGPDGHTRATLQCDGARVLDWQLDGLLIIAPKEVAGIDYRQIGKWADHYTDDLLVEEVKVLRQAIFVSGGRANDIDAIAGAFAQTPAMLGVCHAFQPKRQKESFRPQGTQIDFSDRPEALLADFPDCRAKT